MDLKLYMAEFNPDEGLIAYSIEDEKGDRVALATYKDPSIKKFYPKTMDFFLLGYLPELIATKNNLTVMGPISKNLLDKLSSFKLNINANISKGPNTREYKEEDLSKFIDTYAQDKNLDVVLSEVFKYYE